MEKALWQGCVMRIWRPLRAEAGWNNMIYPVTPQNVSPGAERAEPQGLHPAALVGMGSAWEKQQGAASSHAHRNLTLGAKDCEAMPNSQSEPEGWDAAGAGTAGALSTTRPLQAHTGAQAALLHTAAGPAAAPSAWHLVQERNPTL